MRTFKEMVINNQKVRFSFYRDSNSGMRRSAASASLFRSQMSERQRA